MKYPPTCVVCLALAIAATLGGCAEFPHVDHAYGDAYAAMIQRQTFNPQTTMGEHSPAPGGGIRLENVLKAHHHAVSRAVSSQIRTGRIQPGGG